MPKLPVDYVKAPSFDNPLRATEGKTALVERRLTLRVDEATWDVLQARSEREGVSPEALLQRALDRWLAEPERATTAPPPQQVVERRRPTLRAQLVERIHDRFVRRSWVQRLMTFRELLREHRV